MIEKIKQMLGSVRFWLAVVVGLAVYLEASNILPDAIAKAVEIFSVLGISVRTVDKFN